MADPDKNAMEDYECMLAMRCGIAWFAYTPLEDTEEEDRYALNEPTQGPKLNNMRRCVAKPRSLYMDEETTRNHTLADLPAIDSAQDDGELFQQSLRGYSEDVDEALSPSEVASAAGGLAFPEVEQVQLSTHCIQAPGGDLTEHHTNANLGGDNLIANATANGTEPPLFAPDAATADADCYRWGRYDDIDDNANATVPAYLYDGTECANMVLPDLNSILPADAHATTLAGPQAYYTQTPDAQVSSSIGYAPQQFYYQPALNPAMLAGPAYTMHSQSPSLQFENQVVPPLRLNIHPAPFVPLSGRAAGKRKAEKSLSPEPLSPYPRFSNSLSPTYAYESPASSSYTAPPPPGTVSHRFACSWRIGTKSCTAVIRAEDIWAHLRVVHKVKVRNEDQKIRCEAAGRPCNGALCKPENVAAHLLKFHDASGRQLALCVERGCGGVVRAGKVAVTTKYYCEGCVLLGKDMRKRRRFD